MIVAGIPQPKGSHRALARIINGKPVGMLVEGGTDNGKKKLAVWAKQIETAAAAEIQRTGVAWTSKDAAIAVEALFWIERPKTVRRVWPITKPDLDKLERAVLDAMTRAGLWVDDCQVVDIRAVKRYATTDHPPGLMFRAKEISPTRATKQPTTEGMSE